MRLPCLNARSSAYLRTWLLHSTVFRERCTFDFRATGLTGGCLRVSKSGRRCVTRLLSNSAGAFLHLL